MKTMTQPDPTPTSAGTDTMRAIVQDRYGTDPADVLRLRTIARPAMGDGEVLVRVHAAGVDRGTWHLMSGLPRLMRLMGFGLRRPKQPNPGRGLAGTVVAVGRNVTGLHQGDEVYGTGEGSFAEYCRADARRLAPKPANLTFEQAAAVPVSGVSALQAVRDKAQVKAGEKVLVIGASGGVGTFAVQIAKALGAEVTGVCSAAKTDLVITLGADHVIDYTQHEFADGLHRYDVIVDIGGNSRLADLRRALVPAGRLVIVGAETGGQWTGGFDRQLRAVALSPFVSQELGMLVSSESSEDLSALRGLLESGAVTPAIDRTFPLSEVPDAIGHLTDGGARGKVVVTL